MDKTTLLASLEFTRARLLGILETIETSGQDVSKVLAWRPGPGRAHIAWQAMHCAATHDRYLNARIKGTEVTDPKLCEAYAGGSTPSDDNIPTLAEIRSKLTCQYAPFKAYLESITPQELARVQDFPNNVKRSVGESIMLLIWHEAHHQGQIHLTWNLYKASAGI